jgi:hypothetical protein
MLCLPVMSPHLLLHEDEHLVLQKATGEAILIVRRKATQPSPETILGFVGITRRAFSGIDRSRHAILIDLRAPSLRTAAELSAPLQAFRVELWRDVVAIADLVVTPLGMLQSQRFAKESRRPVRAFSGEHEALAWLRERLLELRQPQRH